MLAASRALSYAATLPPPSFAWYIAMSARRSSSVRSAVPASATTTPTETSTDIRTPGHLGRRGQPLGDLPGLPQRVRHRGGPVADHRDRREQQGELVATEPAEQVTGAGQGAEPVRRSAAAAGRRPRARGCR